VRRTGKGIGKCRPPRIDTDVEAVGSAAPRAAAGGKRLVRLGEPADRAQRAMADQDAIARVGFAGNGESGVG